MHDSPFSKLGFIASIVISLIFSFIPYGKFNINNSFVVFCDVGQGDASYIHIQPNIDILVDAGKNSSVLNCLNKYMPESDKVIELIFLTHLQNDHYGGLLTIPNHFRVLNVFLSNQKTTSSEIQNLYKILKKHTVNIEAIYAGDNLKIHDGNFEMLWPMQEHIEATTQKSDPNDSSQVMRFSFRKHSILYTGDVSPKSLEILLEQSISKVDILKVPHHGSKNGLILEFLVLADPTYAVISSGKNNNYGHPSVEILNMLRRANVNILRTDTLGDIIVRLD